jgi:hypothetical protein
MTSAHCKSNMNILSRLCYEYELRCVVQFMSKLLSKSGSVQKVENFA